MVNLLEALEKLYRKDCATVSPNPKCGNCEKIKNGNECELYQCYLALKKSIDKEEAKEPYYEADGYSEGHLVYDRAFCPNCNRLIEIGCEEQYSYCPDCGQRLDWSGLRSEDYSDEWSELNE